ncbi:unnamed protein product, partial [Mesorhabditis spiculigera]
MPLSALIFLATVALVSATPYCPEVYGAIETGNATTTGKCPSGMFCGTTPTGARRCYETRESIYLKNPDITRMIGPCIADMCPDPYMCFVMDGLNECYDFSTPDNCVDKDPNCALYLKNGYCRSKLYTVDQKIDSCCFTCGFKNVCQDADWKCASTNGYCNGNATTEAQKVDFCRKTCGIC